MNNRKANPIVMAIVALSIIITYSISGIVVSKKEAKLEAQRIEAEKLAEEARRLEEEARKKAEEDAAVIAAEEVDEEELDVSFLSGISPDTFEDTLFIGDSRTNGIASYGNIEGATYFADPGFDIYSIKKDTVELEGMGTVTLEEVLESREFRKIYVMLGYNEIGYDVNKTIQRNQEFVPYLQEKQPTAVIILQANLHIAEKVFTEVETNVRLNEINLGIRKIADNEKIFYIDANPLFDDEKGNLDPELTSDGVHLYAKHYNQWCDWIREETEKILENVSL